MKSGIYISETSLKRVSLILKFATDTAEIRGQFKKGLQHL